LLVAKKLKVAQLRRAELERFAAWLLVESERLVAQDAKRRPVDTSMTRDARDAESATVPSTPVKLASLVLAAMLASSVLSNTAMAQTCAVAAERGHVGDADARRRAIDQTLRRLDELIAGRGCRTLVASSFTDGGAFSPRTLLNVPARHVIRCDSVLGRRHAKSPIGGFAGYQAHLVRQERDRCAAQQLDADSGFAQAKRRLSATVRSLLLVEQATRPSRLDLAGEIKSFVDAGIRDIVVVTTGIDTSAGIPDQLKEGTRLLLVLYEARDSFGGRAATEIAGERWRRAGAVALPWPVLTEGVMQRAFQTGD
jgi:hypothetical protein